MKQKKPDNGYLIVATQSKYYYQSAIFLAESILDYYPNAKIALFTEEELFEEVHGYLFDYINVETPSHIRGKLWALPRTPYNNTMYIDADCEVRHEDISTVFDEMTGDITLTKIRPYSGDQVTFNNGRDEMIHHCGVLCYNSDPIVLEFMEDWWKEYKHQREAEPLPYPDDASLRPWDQYTFWRLLRMDKYKDVSVNFFKDDARWNFVNNYRKNEAKGEIIVYHNTLDGEKVNEGSIKD